MIELLLLINSCGLNINESDITSQPILTQEDIRSLEEIIDDKELYDIIQYILDN